MDKTSLWGLPGLVVSCGCFLGFQVVCIGLPAVFLGIRGPETGYFLSQKRGQNVVICVAVVVFLLVVFRPDSGLPTAYCS